MTSSIRARLILIVSMSAGLAIAIAWLGAHALGSLRQRTDEVMRFDAVIAQTSAAVQSNVLGLRRYEKDMFLNVASATKVAEYADKFQQQRKDLQEQLAVLDALRLAPTDHARLEAMRSDEATYVRAMEAVLAGITAGHIASPAAANEALTPVKDSIRILEVNAQNWSKEASERMRALTNEVEKQAQATQTNLVVLAAIGVLTGIIAAFFLARSILNPLEALRARMKEVATGDGDLTRMLPEDRRDEFGAVAQAFNSFVRKMGTVIVEVRSASSQVRAAAEQLSESSGAVSDAAQTQASSLEEAAATIEEISSSVQQSAQNAVQAQTASSASKSIAVSGGEVIGKAISAMAEISHSSGQISHIITTIDEIAFQTNLLALNAAVEAARAGEQGRGFAVVASEVRALAQRSAAAAREVRDLIRNSEEKVSVGTELVSKSGSTLDQIVGSAKRVGDLVGEMVGATTQLSSAVEQVNQAISEIDASVQRSAAQAEELNATAHAMTQEAKRMDGLISQFKVAATLSTSPVAAGQPQAPTELYARAA